MTASTPLAVATRHADNNYSRFDRYRDRAVLRRNVTELSKLGLDTVDIAARVGLRTEQVRNIICGRINPEHRPEPVNPRDLSDSNVARLERTADAALKLACRQRDDDPQIIWDAISHLNRRELQELAVVLLAAVPIDQPKRQVFAWVYDMEVTA